MGQEKTEDTEHNRSYLETIPFHIDTAFIHKNELPLVPQMNRRGLLKGLAMAGVGAGLYGCRSPGVVGSGLSDASTAVHSQLDPNLVVWLESRSPIQKVADLSKSTTGSSSSAHKMLNVNSMEVPIHFDSPFKPKNPTPPIGPSVPAGGSHPPIAPAIHGGPPRPSRTVKDPDQAAEVVVIGGGMSGLAAGYLLREQKPVVLEFENTFGGNSKGEDWNGIQYSIGAAYLVKPRPEDVLSKNFYTPLGIDRMWREMGDDAVEFNGKIIDGFWNGATDPARAAEFKSAKDFFVHVLNNEYPNIPPVTAKDRQRINELDAVDLLTYLTQKLGKNGELHPHIQSFVEHYCWSSFDCCASVVSAASGLNFLAAEFEGICVLPGGNAKVAEQMLRELAKTTGPDNLRSKTMVTEIRNKSNGKVAIHCVTQDRHEYVIEAKACIVACPKFIARHIVADLPPKQRKAMEKLVYSSYLVGNVLLNKKIDEKFYDLFLLGNGQLTGNCEADARQARASDVVLGTFAQNQTSQLPANNSVLTFYWPLPYGELSKFYMSRPPASGGTLRDELAPEYKKFRAILEPVIGQYLPLVGATMADVYDIRSSTWGHPVVNATKGLLSDGTVEEASKPIGKSIFFCNQDNWALPAIETCLASALDVVSKIKNVLKV
jgi:phytoene dehydrogenase-like protein